MRYILFISILMLGAGCAGTKKMNAIPKKLNGTWLPVKQEIGGTALPKAVYEKQQLIIDGANYTVIAESTDKGTVEYNGNKMDIYGKDGVNKGKHFMAIYKYENEELTICYNLKGDSYPETFDTKGKPMFFLSVFKKG